MGRRQRDLSLSIVRGCGEGQTWPDAGKVPHGLRRDARVGAHDCGGGVDGGGVNGGGKVGVGVGVNGGGKVGVGVGVNGGGKVGVGVNGGGEVGGGKVGVGVDGGGEVGKDGGVLVIGVRVMHLMETAPLLP